MKRIAQNVVASIDRGNNWKKLVYPTVNRGITAFPKKPAELERLGIRFDYDGEIEIDDIIHHKYRVQPNAGNVPSVIKKWRNAHGGTHATMVDVLIKKDSTQEEVKEVVEKAIEGVDE